MNLKGIAASDGLVCGRAYRLVEPDLSFERRQVSNLDNELKRFHQALEAAVSDVETIKMRATKSLGTDGAQVFSTHITMLQDPDLIAAVERTIREDGVNAESAWANAVADFEETLEKMTDNPYMQERVTDLHDINKRVLAHLLQVALPDLALIDQPVIVVTHDLIPSDTVSVNPQFILGFVTDVGGRTSHSSILARSLNIPAVVGTQTATQAVKPGDQLVINGSQGTVIVDPDLATWQTAKQAMVDRQANLDHLATFRNHKTTTKDGRGVTLAANIGNASDLPSVLQNGAEAVGLMRTEFLYMNGDQLPTEDEQFAVYREVVKSLSPKTVVIRTLDIGGDKPLPYLHQHPEANPFLGERAIRQSLAHQQIFRSQLRALLRASAYGHLRIMFPMIATLDEFRQAKAIYDDERSKLTTKQVPLGDVKVGMMVEVPAAALLADRFAQEADFMSIGTNDLIGYTLAADRTNQDVAYLYQPYHPAVLRLINQVISAGHAAGIPVAMCGEMAGDPIAVPLLLGMGLDEFSMGAGTILKTRELIGQLTADDLGALAETALNSASTSQEVVTMVQAAVPGIVS
ncbi:phosphoenolpyruvate-protein kinase [Levilactobacillus senmaizukei DSM 21775 = NBRC 103853]|uniref:Phosphoenolpyruvate-protein phosphotransferase n=1 Tax=Levilactobacillus senmaizukei DSM 21775 = NBRC 103853 TaxID=1423803 RepID=A0A0R2DGE3_9LACO|nr:phosphoenolpyruvate-protein kinase [Levilactobacillus senmaizukei DSM 21775 = NBRC 103853]